MARKQSVAEAADNIKPYVERAMSDDKLRADVMHAFKTAKKLYEELTGGDTKPVTLATRVATDDDIRDKLRQAIEDLRKASDRLQGKKDHGGRNTALLVAGIALGILYNPLTGSETRRFIRELVTGEQSSDA
ncbi:MAG: hypothetical protein JO186_13240 [Actinobacteria bacterium]|nr:hypothetical protein [Actinomycetota bacterium]MBV8395119.1 hypothetical protein [Actinomycetota bacterium]MBV8598063.1 hypothetical protein [Actinomycetota bacterium]